MLDVSNRVRQRLLRGLSTGLSRKSVATVEVPQHVTKEDLSSVDSA